MQRRRINDISEDELQLPTTHTIYDNVYAIAERCASTRMGQYVIDRADRVLKMVESTAKWSLPLDKDEVKRERPLPWGPFLIMIVVLRIVRMWLSLAALMIGNSPVMPRDLVQFIQIRRRKLHGMRSRGLTVMRRREVESKSTRSNSNEVGYISQIQRLLSCAICRPGMHREPVRQVYIQDGREYVVEEQVLSPHELSKYTNTEDSESSVAIREKQKMTTADLLNKYVEESSEDDPDFLAESGATDETSTSNASSDSSTNLAEEVNDLKADLNTNYGFPANQTEREQNDYATVVTENGPNYGAGDIRDVVTNQSMPSTKILEQIEEEPESSFPAGNGNRNAVQRRGITTVGNAATAAIIDSEDAFVISAINDCSLVNSDDSEILNVPSFLDINSLSVSNSSSASSSSSSSTVASIVLNEEFHLNVSNSEPTTPTSSCSLAPLELSTLSSASSSEDVFYSPIGSPPDFDASYRAAQMMLNANVETNHEDVPSNSNLESSAPNSGQNTFYQQNRHQRQQPNQFQRYRHKNRH